MDRKFKLHTLKNIPTASFTMTPLELKDYIDFEVRRVYFITHPTGDHLTGQHCHRQLEDELFVMISGSCTIILDDGHGREEVELIGGQSAIYVPHLVWHGFKDLSDDAILMALTNTNYSADRSDYCEDYQEFQDLVK